MKPYWEGDGIRLYLGDCREVTEWLEADVLITDPPYGRAWKQGDTGSGRGWASDRHDGIANDMDTSVRDAVLSAWGTSRPAIVFGDLLLPPPGSKQALVFDKGPSGFTGSVGGYRRNVEGIYLIGPHGSGLGGRSPIISTAGIGQTNLVRKVGHPHAKPLDVLQVLISNSPGWRIADPFAGSGATLTAAKLQGRPAIGVELEERYCEIAARRLDQGVLDFGSAS